VDVIWLLVYWLVLLAAIYTAYIAVREAEQALIKRPFSVPLTLATVTAGAALLFTAFNLVTNNYVEGNSSYLNLYANGWWPELISAVLATASGWLIRRDVLVRIGQGSCPQCGTPLLGHGACPSCAWGSFPVLDTLVGAVRRSIQTPTPSRAPAPTVRALSAAGSGIGSSTAAAPPSAPTVFCIMCGSAVPAGQTFCGKCGTPVESEKQ
jgi:hypothetical protein